MCLASLELDFILVLEFLSYSKTFIFMVVGIESKTSVINARQVLHHSATSPGHLNFAQAVLKEAGLDGRL